VGGGGGGGGMGKSSRVTNTRNQEAAACDSAPFHPESTAKTEEKHIKCKKKGWVNPRSR